MAHERTSYLYARAKLHNAVRTLATMHGTLRTRLIAAYRYLSPLMESDLPFNLRAELRTIKGALTKNPPNPRYAYVPGDDFNHPECGRLGATVLHMRINKLVAVATRIADLADELEEHGVQHDAARLAKNREQARHA